jgi:DNA-directed RNA polymerase II subunit RPB2
MIFFFFRKKYLQKKMLDYSDQQKIFKAYFNETSLVAIQLDSFNEFIDVGIPNIVNGTTIDAVDKSKGVYSVLFENVHIGKPTLTNIHSAGIEPFYPHQARLMSSTYCSTIYVDIIETRDLDGVKTVKKNIRVILATIPIMVRSNRCNLHTLLDSERSDKDECPNDLGGHFIINGVERSITAQIRSNHNCIYVFPQKEGEKYKYIASIRSMSIETGHSVLTQVMVSSNLRYITIDIPNAHIKDHFPIGVVFKAMGFANRDFINLIGLDVDEHPKVLQHLQYIIRDSVRIPDFYQLYANDTDSAYDDDLINDYEKLPQSEKNEYKKKMQSLAIEYISKSVSTHIADGKTNFTWQLIENEMFPHLGASATILEKGYFLALIVRKLLSVIIGLRAVDDRDNYTNKRVDTTGVLCTTLFRTVFKRFLSSTKIEIQTKLNHPDIVAIVNRYQKISKDILSCFSTGNWGVARSNTYMIQGVSQVLDRMTYKATLSHLRRLIYTSGMEGKNTDIRQLKTSQYGFICPYETPDGKKVGSVMNFAMMSHVTSRIPSVEILKIIELYFKDEIIELKNVELNRIYSLIRILINGVNVGFIKENGVKLFVSNFCQNRLVLALGSGVSCIYDPIDAEIRIASDEGRLIRPVLVVKNKTLTLKKRDSYVWSDLVRDGDVRYIDASTQEMSVIAMTFDYLKTQTNDYCEIHPVCKMGVVASAIPWSDHSPSPRICYQSSMGKQSLGVPMLNAMKRVDTGMYILSYPHRPIVSTMPSDVFGYNDMPSGNNIIIAVACYGSGNTDDSLIINQGSIDRGLFNITKYFTVEDDEKRRNITTKITVCYPPESGTNGFKRRNGNYKNLDPNTGLPKIGSTIKKGDILIGKISTTSDKNGGSDTIQDVSVRVDRVDEEGKVEAVYDLKNPQGMRIIKVVMREMRIIQLGDKAASTCAQKGTIGQIIRQEDMPFSTNGMTPDIIINPLAFPSRMTVNMLIEIVMGKYCCIAGEYGDCTPYSPSSRDISEKVCSDLQKFGSYERHGWETMSNGYTGEQFDAQILMGVSYYQRLKHQVMDKEHARSTGNITTLTRQSVDGRNKFGGMKCGNMETDCMVSHGCSALLEDRLFSCSDKNYSYVCNDCGRMASPNGVCNVCGCDNIVSIKLPYSTKLLFQELGSVAFDLRFETTV